jgi:hypothetical protein
MLSVPLAKFLAVSISQFLLTSIEGMNEGSAEEDRWISEQQNEVRKRLARASLLKNKTSPKTTIPQVHPQQHRPSKVASSSYAKWGFRKHPSGDVWSFISGTASKKSIGRNFPERTEKAAAYLFFLLWRCV